VVSTKLFRLGESAPLKIGLVGPNGFLGQAFFEVLRDIAVVEKFVRGDDLSKLGNCEVIINASGNSSKVLADRDPVRDLEDNVLFPLSLSLMSRDSNSLLVHISSGEVGNAIKNYKLHDDPIAGLADQTSYTLSKMIGETLVRKHAKKWIIVRPYGLVGKGLRKGPVFDLLRGDPVWVDPRSTFRLMRTITTAELTYQLILNHLSGKSINNTYDLSGSDALSLEQIASELKMQIVSRPDLPIVNQLFDLESVPDEIVLPSSLDELKFFVENDLSTS
jgi:dTDP-4-dehydrorhamnose reductase